MERWSLYWNRALFPCYNGVQSLPDRLIDLITVNFHPDAEAASYWDNLLSIFHSNHWGAQHNFSLCLCQPCSYGCSSADGTGASIIACLMDVMVVVWCILGVFCDRPWGWQSDRDRPLRSWWQHSSGAGWPRWGCWCWWRMEDGDVVQWWWWWGWRCARKT